MEQPNLETFLKDVDRHEMKIIRDEGVYRHIRFKRPNSSCMYFDIITWPGNLCYTGDMGTYTFRRINDMLYFFGDDEDLENYGINPYYWSEKCESKSIFGNGIQEYCEDYFMDKVNEWFNDWSRDYLNDKVDLEELEELKNCSVDLLDEADRERLNYLESEKEKVSNIISEVEEEIKGHLSWKDIEFEPVAYNEIMDFKSDILGDDGPDFTDFFEVNCSPYTYHYLWCCYALRWGCNQYFKKKNENKFNFNYC